MLWVLNSLSFSFSRNGVENSFRVPKRHTSILPAASHSLLNLSAPANYSKHSAVNRRYLRSNKLFRINNLDDSKVEMPSALFGDSTLECRGIERACSSM